ncbi:MAG: hypothetical protein HY821_02435 [Acidobacteria bacterium]|nr:hypothetical protein [Acidobacteriota bacterium]
MRLVLAATGLLSMLLLGGCAGSWERLPAQRPEPAGRDPDARPCFAESREPRAAALFRGVLFNGERQSWTTDEPELTCTLPEGGAWEAVLQFDVPRETFGKTGPLSFEMSVEGQPLAGLRCPKPGSYEWRAAVPSELAQMGRKLTLRARIRPPFEASDDGQHLGVLLTGGGFLRR